MITFFFIFLLGCMLSEKRFSWLLGM